MNGVKKKKKKNVTPAKSKLKELEIETNSYESTLIIKWQLVSHLFNIH